MKKKLTMGPSPMVVSVHENLNCTAMDDAAVSRPVFDAGFAACCAVTGLLMPLVIEEEAVVVSELETKGDSKWAKPGNRCKWLLL